MEQYLIFEIGDDGAYGRFYADSYGDDAAAVAAVGKLTDRPCAIWCHGRLVANVPRVGAPLNADATD